MNEPSTSPISSRAWCCVKTQPKREQVAAGQLERLDGVEVFAPRVRFKRRTPRGKVWFEESLFPGYIFARFDDAMQRAVAGAIGVRGLVKFAGACATVSQSVIDVIRAQTPEAGPVVIPDEPEVKEGDEAVVAEGSMMGLKAVITRVMPGGERVKVLLEMMGTAIEAEMPVDTLEKVT